MNTFGDRCHSHRQAYARGAAKIADGNWRGKFLCGLLLLLTGALMFGCAAVVTPLQPGNLSSMMKSNHGLVLGRMHLVWNGREQQAGLRFPFNVRLRITEEKSGAR